MLYHSSFQSFTEARIVHFASPVEGGESVDIRWKTAGQQLDDLAQELQDQGESGVVIEKGSNISRALGSRQSLAMEIAKRLEQKGENASNVHAGVEMRFDADQNKVTFVGSSEQESTRNDVQATNVDSFGERTYTVPRGGSLWQALDRSEFTRQQTNTIANKVVESFPRLAQVDPGDIYTFTKNENGGLNIKLTKTDGREIQEVLEPNLIGAVIQGSTQTAAIIQ